MEWNGIVAGLLRWQLNGGCGEWVRDESEDLQMLW